MLNLEDGVSPEQKPEALRLCVKALEKYQSIDKKMVVRVNPLDEGGLAEIALLNAYRPDAIRIPKIRTVEDVKQALDAIDEPIEVHLSIETKEAWLNLAQLRIHPRVKAFYLGVLDLFAELGLSQALLTPQNPTLHYLLSHFLVTSRALGVKPVSFVYQEHKNDEGLFQWLALEKEMEFDAKGCISPQQVALIHQVFGHNDEELERCRTIVRLFEEHRERGISGFVHERYGFIDEPIYKGALAVLAQK